MTVNNAVSNATASTVVAFPSMAPGGLEAEISSHFGHCDLFTLVTLGANGLEAVDTVRNPPHEQGGCMGSVNLLAGHGVKALVAGGMGMRPLQGCASAGIAVYHGEDALTVADGVKAFAAGRLAAFDADLTCGGDHDHS